MPSLVPRCRFRLPAAISLISPRRRLTRYEADARADMPRRECRSAPGAQSPRQPEHRAVMLTLAREAAATKRFEPAAHQPARAARENFAPPTLALAAP